MTRRLLAWYDRNRRHLPWRRTRDPYRIWVSEIMLQQTRVETVLPYYRRFIRRFPAPSALAKASLEEVLALWSGLGYYRRARSMYGAAGQIARAGFPRTARELDRLPGIGSYTAAAIASIAFGECVPVLDGNTARVLSRLLGVRGRPEEARTRRRLLRAAARLLDPERPGDSNQALMELGATLCSPRRPRCAECPLASGCRAVRSGRPERYPGPRPRQTPRKVRLVAALVERRDAFFLVRRGDDSAQLAGTWEVPWAEIHDAGGGIESALADRYGGCWRLGRALGKVRHSITDRRLEVSVHRARLTDSGTIAEAQEAGWFTPAELGQLPVSSLVKKALRLARL